MYVKRMYLQVVMLLLSVSVFGQINPTLSLDLGSNVTSATPNAHIAVMGGFTNWQGDMLAIGALIKRYDRTYTNGARMMVNLMLKKPFIFYTHGDVYIRALSDQTQLRSARLELGAGLGWNITEHLQVSAGVQSEDWNPHLKVNSDGSLLVRISYNLFKED